MASTRCGRSPTPPVSLRSVLNSTIKATSSSTSRIPALVLTPQAGTASSKASSPLSPRAWEWGWRSVTRSLKLIRAACGRNPDLPLEPSSASPCLWSQELAHDRQSNHRHDRRRRRFDKESGPAPDEIVWLRRGNLCLGGRISRFRSPGQDIVPYPGYPYAGHERP